MPDKWGDSIPDIPEIPDDLQLTEDSTTRPSFDPRYINKETISELNVDAENVLLKPDSIGMPIGTAGQEQQANPDGFTSSDIVPLLSAIHSELKLISSLLNEMR
jgi:hypothetical protein